MSKWFGVCWELLKERILYVTCNCGDTSDFVGAWVLRGRDRWKFNPLIASNSANRVHLQHACWSKKRLSK